MPKGSEANRRTLAAIAAVLFAAAPATAQVAAEGEPITIGVSYAMRTQEANRHINVVVPTNYGEDAREYSLVIVLDGGLQQDFFLTLGMERWNQLWQRSAPAILVGIETVDRQRELLPPTHVTEERDRYPTAGRSSAFRDWLGQTVVPMLRSRHRTDGRAFLIGESTAGHFAVETWAVQPTLFDGYAALSPSLQWNDQALARQFGTLPKQARPPLFISLADGGGATEEGLLRLLADAGPAACFADRRKTLVHANTLHGLFPEALQHLLPTDADNLDDFGLSVGCVPVVQEQRD